MELREGIYVWDGSRFVEAKPASRYVVPLDRDEVYLVYFHNLECPHCTRFHPELVEALREERVPRGLAYMVVCTWFASECGSEEAKTAFIVYGVKTSPAVLAVLVRGGQVTQHVNLYTLALLEGSSRAKEIIAMWRRLRERLIEARTR